MIKLTVEQQKKVDAYRICRRMYDGRIRILAAERDAALRVIDEEYTAYVEAYGSYYEDGGLDIASYYKAMNELEAIGAEFNQQDVDHEALWRKYRERIEKLERMLVA